MLSQPMQAPVIETPQRRSWARVNFWLLSNR